jgi:hypothetical protein
MTLRAPVPEDLQALLVHLGMGDAL